jgi:hypothetical protein
MQQYQTQHEQQQQSSNSRYHLRSQSANQAQNITQRPRQLHGIEAELDNTEVEEQLNHNKATTIKN